MVGHLAWCNHRVSREVLEVRGRGEAAVHGQGSEQGTYQQQLQESLRRDFLATVNGTIKCMPLYEERMKKHEREDVACTGLLEASESLTSHRDNLRKELVLELCEWICRKIDAAKHRSLRWAYDMKTD